MTTPTFIRLRPCIDPQGHKFIAVHPAEGTWGYVFMACERCGHRREELQN